MEISFQRTFTPPPVCICKPTTPSVNLGAASVKSTTFAPLSCVTMCAPCTDTSRSFQSLGFSARSPSGVGCATQPRPPLSYRPPVCLPGLGSTSTCIPSMSGPCCGSIPVIFARTNTPLLPSASPLNFRRSVKSRYFLSVVRYPYLLAVLSQRMVPCSTTHFSSPFFFQPLKSFPLKRATQLLSRGAWAAVPSPRNRSLRKCHSHLFTAKPPPSLGCG